MLALSAGVAWADQFDLYGYGPRAVAMSGAMTAEANDYTAVFYNPALLVRRKEINFGFHVQWNHFASEVQRKDLASTLDCKYCQPPDSAGGAVGLLFPLAGKVKNHLALGLGVHLPSASMARVFAPDPARPYWYQYTSNPERLVMHLGAGIRITDELQLGAGLQVLADLVGNGADVRVDVFSKTIMRREIDSGLTPRMSPVVGIGFQPLKNLRFGVNWRAEMKLVYDIPANVELDGIGKLAMRVSGIAHYTPHNVRAGMAWDPTENFTVTADAEWMNWSAAPSPYTDLTIDISGATLTALGLDKALDMQSAKQAPGFSDTLSGRMGFEYRLSERFAARAGLSYRPTMIPKQNVEGTNLLDGTTVGGSAGVGFNFPDPLEIFAHPVTIDLAVQGALILPREALKPSTAADGVPSYSYSARMYGVTGALRYDF